jgi:hypothetical protein
MHLVLDVRKLIGIQRNRTLSVIGSFGALSTMLILLVLAARQTAQGKEQDASAISIASVGALLAGRYDNSAQVAQGKETGESPAPQHVTITIEPTQQADWELWRVHMDVDPTVAQSAGSDTSLDAAWAMNVSRGADDKSLQLIPYTLDLSVNAATVKASAFDKTQWFSLEACALRGDFAKLRIVAQASGDEMCVAATMNLGGKRAFLPTWIKRDDDWLHVQLIYFGKPWQVDARRVSIPSRACH